MANYFTTWFEANFNAYPEIRGESYKTMKEKFIMFMKGPKPPFNVFSDKYNIYSWKEKNNCIVPHTKIKEPKLDTLMYIYNQTKTLNEFIRKIDYIDYTLYSLWLSNLIQDFFPSLFFRSWILPVHNVHVALVTSEISKCDISKNKILSSSACERHSLDF